MKSRQPPISDLESAHQTAIACHLANIAMRVGRVVHWDAKQHDDRRRSGSRRPCSPSRTVHPGIASCKAIVPGVTSQLTRRELASNRLSLLATRRRWSALLGDAPRMCLAYTSFAVRMLQGRDILKIECRGADRRRSSTLSRGSVRAARRSTCRRCESHEPSALARSGPGRERDGLALEVSIPSTLPRNAGGVRAGGLDGARPRREARSSRAALRTPLRDVQDARRRGRRRGQMARDAARDARREFEAARRFSSASRTTRTGSPPNWSTLLKPIDSPFVGCCVDFGNNIALLEDPD